MKYWDTNLRGINDVPEEYTTIGKFKMLKKDGETNLCKWIHDDRNAEEKEMKN